MYIKRIGIDIGSTTIKAVITNEENEIIYKTYKRHMSSITSSLLTLLSEIKEKCSDNFFYINFTGSAGMNLAHNMGIQFTQEVISATKALRTFDDSIDVCIELGGEDAKIIFFDGVNIEQRMNGTCAGGTGAFIDQMATLLNVSSAEVNDLAKNYEKIYPIASRCGVFAKSDIQPLLNQGAKHEDIAVSIYQAIVNQTITGLSQGKKIKGNVAFLGGPLTFASELRKRFIETLKLTSVFIPENGEVFVALGASIAAKETKFSIDEVIELVKKETNREKVNLDNGIEPLFKDITEYDNFIQRHSVAKIESIDIKTYNGNAYLGIDAGSTTTKMVLLSEDNKILFQYYSHNLGNPVEIVKNALLSMYQELHPGITIKGAFSTGYGEQLIKNAFNLDGSEVETICHYKAASYFNKDVDFIIDIGGQDMKCFKVENGVITSIILNEACSSGCGSFIETFSTSLGYEISDFAELAINSRNPVDLGSRCTVFMNSSVKQAQADAASTEDISAGLAISVVKNALYKVIRAVDVKREFGENIIVQGGTFYNNAVLRSFEREIKMNVTRPNISGLMGAFGASILAKENSVDKSQIVTKKQLDNFLYNTKSAVCKKCSNYCQLTVNIFNDSKKYISGNRCEKGAGLLSNMDDIPNLYLYKYEKLTSYISKVNRIYKGTIGIPLGLNMYENIPFWHTFFTALGYKLVYSERSSKTLYELGQDSIPSDTVCYPAKLIHGHIESLLEKDVDFIFYPNMQFNVIEKSYRDNEYNCPVVAHYPELIKANMDSLKGTIYLDPYISINNPHSFAKNIKPIFTKGKLIAKKGEILRAYDKAIKEYEKYRLDVINEGKRAIEYSEKHNKNLIILAGRPYHIDPEINHGMAKLLRSLECVVVSEDALNFMADQSQLNVINQWSYHTRLYDTAKYVTTLKNANLIQLVSFGCGLDAITSDEVKSILEESGKLYTQIKIDEVSNLGTVNIRIRSLLSTMKGVQNG